MSEKTMNILKELYIYLIAIVSVPGLVSNSPEWALGGLVAGFLLYSPVLVYRWTQRRKAEKEFAANLWKPYRG